MPSQERAMRSARQTQTTVYLVAALYMGIGLVLLGWAAFSGQIFIALVGLVIVSLAAAAAVLLITTLRLSIRLDEIAHRMGQMDNHLEEATRLNVRLMDNWFSARQPAAEPSSEVSAPEAGAARASAAAKVQETNLASAGADVGELVAGTLPRQPFPRLANSPAAQPAPANGPNGRHHQGQPSREAATAPLSSGNGNGKSGGHAATRVHGDWAEALDSGDLAESQARAARLAADADADAINNLSLGVQIDAAPAPQPDDEALRERFVASVRRRDYAEALHIGRQLAALDPHGATAEEYARLVPLLEYRLKRQSSPQRTAAHA